MKSKRLCLHRSEILRESRQEALDCGFLTCHETASGYVTFPHVNIQIFLAAFYLVQSLDTGETMEDVGLPLKNVYFLKFCVWLMADVSVQQYFQNHNRVYHDLAFRVAAQIDNVVINMSEISETFPVFGDQEKDHIVWEFFSKVLSLCSKIKELYFKPGHSVYWSLESRTDILSSLRAIGNPRHVRFLVELKSQGLTIVEDAEQYMGLADRLIPFSGDNRHPSLCVYMPDSSHKGKEFNISKYTSPGLGKLHLHAWFGYRSYRIVAQHELPRCLFLTELWFNRLQIDESIVVTLANSMKDGNLPVVTQLHFTDCEELEGKLPVLFRTKWPTLTHLDLSCSQVHTTDLEYLASHENVNCPNITFVSLYSDDDTLNKTDSLANFEWSWPKLTQLFLRASSFSTSIMYRDNIFKLLSIPPSLTDLGLNLVINSDEHLIALVRSLASTQLRKLDISHSLGITGNLSVLLRHSFPSLNSLVLSHCWLNSQDLCSLAQASVEGRLPQLTHLDITENWVSGELGQLLGNSFPSLNSLILSDCELNSQDLCSLAQAKQNSTLPALKELDISKNDELTGHLQNLFQHGQKWEHLIKLKVEQDIIVNDNFQTMLSKVQSRCLRSLEELSFSAYHVDGIDKVKWFNLRQLRVNCSKHSSAKILGQIAEGVEQGMFPKLVNLKICMKSLFVFDKFSKGTESIKKTYQILENVKSGSVTRHEVVDFLVRCLANIYHKKEKHYRSMYRLLEDMEEVLNKKWDALFVKFCNKYLSSRAPSIQMVDHLEVFMFDTMIESWKANKRKLPDIEVRLGKYGVKVQGTLTWYW